MYEYKAKLVKIVDGDTIDCDIYCGFDIVLSDQRIRLYGIDTPESRTRDLEEKKFGKLASKFLEDNLTEEFVIRTHKDAKGKYGRILGELIVYNPEQEKWNRNLNREMISKNLAVEYKGQSKELVEEGHLFNREVLYSKGLVERP